MGPCSEETAVFRVSFGGGGEKSGTPLAFAGDKNGGQKETGERERERKAGEGG